MKNKSLKKKAKGFKQELSVKNYGKEVNVLILPEFW